MLNFQILAVIGEGSFSKVFRVRRQIDAKVYALKKMKLTELSISQKNSCLNEIRLLSKITHPNIIQYKQAFIDQNHLCLVMELAQHGDFLRFMIKRRKAKHPFSEEQVCVFARQMANGIAALHKTNIIHRDIKADNFFICEGNRVKLGDMNVSTISRNGMAMTKIGTPYYKSPEIWLEKAYSTATDMWSFGCLLYEMLTFTHPFTGRDIAELKQNILKGQYQPLPAQCSIELAKIISGCLVLDPKMRITAEDIINNGYLRQKYNQFKQATMQKDPMNLKTHTITCARLLKEITLGTVEMTSINLPPSNYSSKQKPTNQPIQNRKNISLQKRNKPLSRRLITVMQIYNTKKTFINNRGITLPPRAQLIR